jgi:hypothetical protein
MFDALCKATDEFKEVRRKYAAGEVSYQAMHDAAAAVLRLRVSAEIRKYGKARTKVTPLTIASFMRS